MTDKLLNHHAEGSASAPALLLGPSLGTSYALWDQVAPELSITHRVVRWDLPGHGGSAADLIGAGATVGDLADLVLALADSFGIERFAYAGVSLGGAVGLHLAVHHPERISSLAVICSSAHFNGAKPWEERAALVRSQGLARLAASADSRWFTSGFTVPALVQDHRDADRDAYAACCDALAAFDLRERLPEISSPTLLIAGREDPATPPAHLREIADAVPGATLVELPGLSIPGRVSTAHSSTMTAVSSTNTASGSSAAGGSICTASPASSSALTYAPCCLKASSKSIGVRSRKVSAHSEIAAEGWRTIARMGRR